MGPSASELSSLVQLEPSWAWVPVTREQFLGWGLPDLGSNPSTTRPTEWLNEPLPFLGLRRRLRELLPLPVMAAKVLRQL